MIRKVKVSVSVLQMNKKGQEDEIRNGKDPGKIVAWNCSDEITFQGQPQKGKARF